MAPADDFVPPTDPRQAAICWIWQDVLDVNQVGIDDDFFELGGHSLFAMQVLARVRREFGVALPIRVLLDGPTVRQLTAAVRAADTVDDRTISRRPGALELSYAQRRLWFLDQLAPQSTGYSVQALYEIRGRLDCGAFERALSGIWSRHDVLRGRCVEHDGEPRLVVDDPGPFPLVTVDLTHLDPVARGTEVRQLVREDMAQPFDLARGPLMRALLIRTADDEHMVLLSFHHIVIDKRSIHVLWTELSALYDAFLAGRPAPLAPLALQYSDYAAWQRSWLTDERIQAQLDRWRKALDGVPPSLDLATDYPRPAILRGRGGRVEFEVPVEVADELRRIGRVHNATLFMVLLTAFDIVLSRYSGSCDIITGSPLSGRVRPELDNLIGFFANSIPLRLRWSGNPTFTQLLATARDCALDAYAQEDVQFDRLVDDLVTGRDLSRNPIFQVWFDVDTVTAVPSPEGCTVKVVRTESVNTRLDLEMLLEVHGPQLTGWLNYNSDLFAPATAERIVRHFSTLLGAIAAAPDARISRLSMMDVPDQMALIGNDQSPQLPALLDHDPLVAFGRHVAATPEKPALIFRDQTLTYAGLDARANQTAHMLRGYGVGPDTVVGVCLPPGTEVFMALLGILKAGGAYLPLDPALPDERLAAMLIDAGARVVLTDSHFAPRIPAGVERVLVGDHLRGRPDTAPPRIKYPSNLAYVVYTSGSTGRPKGIAVTAQTIATFTGWKLATRPGPRRCAQLTSIGFDVSVQEFFVTLLGGGTLVIADEEERRDPARLLDLMSLHAVERVYMSPGLLRQVAGEWAASTTAGLALTEVIAGGEALHVTDEVRQFLAALPDAALENQYGPSETHHVTSHTLTGDRQSWPAEPPIGQPIAGVEVYLLDHTLQPVPVGVRGEVYVGGTGLARGYLGQPGLTAERFVANPFRPGQRMYRSGDVAIRRADGVLTFHGRTDDQVKIRGYRIEPGEVQAALLAHPRVREAVVLPFDGPNGTQLVAYLAPAPGEAVPELTELRSFLRPSLPEYMLPVALVPLAALPLNRSGKVDRGALLPPPTGLRASTRPYTAPRTAHEAALCEIWTEVLRLHRVGIDDDFFELGGHSLLATQAVARVRRQFDVALPIHVLFERPTVRQLAAALEELIVDEVAKLDAEQVRQLLTAAGDIEV